VAREAASDPDVATVVFGDGAAEHAAVVVRHAEVPA
jgi:hypothetical protein